MMKEAGKLNEITWELEKRGYKVRRHYYEYYIRYGGAFVCFVSLFPAWNQMFVLLRREMKERVDKVINVI